MNNTLEIVLRLKDELTRQLSATSSQLSKFQGNLRSLSGDFLIAGAGMTAALTAPIIAAKVAAVSFAEIGGRYSSIADSFGSMTEGMGLDARQFTANVAAATGGQIDNLKILQSATRGLALIGKDAFNNFGDDFVKMAELSKKAARATGQDVDFMFESLVLGIARESKLILDNLGISLDITKAKDDYAASLGKTSEQLTQSEAKHAVLNGALTQLEGIYGNVAVSAGGFSGAMQQLQTFITNARIEIGRELEPVLADLTKELVRLGQDVLPVLIGTLRDAMAWFAALSPEVQKNIILSIGFAAALGPVTVAIGGLLGWFGSMIAIFRSLSSGFLFLLSFGKLLIPVATSLGTAIASLSAPVLILIAAFAGLVAVGILIWQNWEFLQLKAVEIWSTITSFMSQLPDRIGGFFYDLFLTRIPYAVGYAAGWLSVKIPEMVTGVITWFSELPGKVAGIFELVRSWIVSKIQSAWTWISTELPTWPGKNYSFIQSIPSRVAQVFEDAKKWAISKVTEMYDGVLSIWNKLKDVFNWIRDSANAAWDATKRGFEAGKSVGMQGYANGGWVDRTGPAVVHQGEYVLSKDMLAGRQSVDSRVMNSNNQTVQISAVINNPMDIDKMLDDLSWRLNYAYS